MPYSVMLEKKYIPVEEMTAKQRDTYEYYVNDYEERFRSGEQILALELTFSITHWSDASQYRFEPKVLRIYKTARKKRLVYTISLLEKKEFFVIEPPLEVRTKKEIHKDLRRIKKIQKSDSKEKINFEEDEDDIQDKENRGRRAIFLTVTFDTSALTFHPNTLEANLTWGFNKYFFAGLNFGFDLDFVKKGTAYSMAFFVGGNYDIGKYFRPFVQAGVGIKTDNNILVDTALGFDLKLHHFMLTFGGDFNWQIDLQGLLRKSQDASEEIETSNSFKFFVGAGFAW